MKNKTNQEISFYLTLIFLIIFIGCFIKTGIAEAGSEHNIWGWAWSENIGWISLNSINCDPDGDGITEGGASNPDYPQCPEGEDTVNYGVHIDLDDPIDPELPDFVRVKGYAWSENIGWIKFDPSVVGCPAGCISSWVDISGGAEPALDFYGWARACSVFESGCSGALADNSKRGGWDGWISLHDDELSGERYAVVFNWIVPRPPDEIRGFAWAEAVIGWISFSCLNLDICGTSDYTAWTSVEHGESGTNQPPYAESAQLDGTPTYCGVGPGQGQVRFAWEYNDNEGDQQYQYQLQVDDNADFSSPIVNYTASQTVNPGSQGTSAVIVITGIPAPGQLEVGYRTIYYWQVRVKAATGNPAWSDWVEYNDPLDPDGDGNSRTFTTPPRAYPYPDFAYIPENPKIEEEVTFTNLSKCYDVSDIEYDCDTLEYMLHEWNYGDGSPLDYDPPPPIIHTYMQEGDYTVGLRVTNINNPTEESCLEEKPLKAKLPVPGWKETAPF